MAITTAQIHAAADQIDKEGKRPTLSGVRTVLGGGSFSTIQEAMKTWKHKDEEEEVNAAPVPNEVTDEGEKATAAIWQIAERKALEAYNDQRAELLKHTAEAEQAVSDALAAADQQANQVESLNAEIAQAKQLIEETTAINNAQAKEIDELKNALKDEGYQTIDAQKMLNTAQQRCEFLEAYLMKIGRPAPKQPAAKKN